MGVCEMLGQEIGRIDRTGGKFWATSRVDNERVGFATENAAIAWLQDLWATYQSAEQRRKRT